MRSCARPAIASNAKRPGRRRQMALALPFEDNCEPSNRHRTVASFGAAAWNSSAWAPVVSVAESATCKANVSPSRGKTMCTPETTGADVSVTAVRTPGPQQGNGRVAKYAARSCGYKYSKTVAGHVGPGMAPVVAQIGSRTRPEGGANG